MESTIQYKSLSEIAFLLNGYAFKSKQYTDSGIRIIRIANVQDGYIVDEEPCFYSFDTLDEIKKYMLNSDDLLVSLTGNVGRVGILQETMLPAALNQRVCCVRLKNNDVNLKFLFYYLNRKKFVQDCIKASSGVAQLNLSTKWLSDYKVPILSYKKQEKIVARIEELFSQLDSGVETLKKIKQQLEVYKQALYVDVYKNFNDFSYITEYFDITGGLTKNSKRNELPIKMPYLRVANVYYNELDFYISKGDPSNGKSKSCTVWLRQNEQVYAPLSA